MAQFASFQKWILANRKLWNLALQVDLLGIFITLFMVINREDAMVFCLCVASYCNCIEGLHPMHQDAPVKFVNDNLTVSEGIHDF